MKIKLFVAREIQYFELGIFSFNSYIYYLTRGFSALSRAFNLLTRAFSILTCKFELVTCTFELVTRKFELLTRGFELVTRGFELVTRNSCFPFLPEMSLHLLIIPKCPQMSQNKTRFSFNS